MDIVGILRGWKVFDHAGHLGGVIFAVYVPLSIATDYYINNYYYVWILSLSLCLLSIGYIIGGFIVCLKG